jgi:hypothetical protein
MSAMVGNFVHKVRSYRVLEVPDWPKTYPQCSDQRILAVADIIATRRS